MTVNSSHEESRQIALETRAILRRLQEGTETQSAAVADDLLLFLYRLRDGFRIVTSTSKRFRGTSFDFLQELLYQLESRPDATLQSGEWRELIETLLQDLSAGKIVLAKKENR